MSDGLEIRFDEFKKDMLKAADEYPRLAERGLSSLANKLVNRLKENSPDSGIDRKKKITSSWKKKIEGFSGKNLEANVYSVAPHVGLLDRGHRIITKSGEMKGFVAGTHFIQNSINEFMLNDYNEGLEKIYKSLSNRIKREGGSSALVEEVEAVKSNRRRKARLEKKKGGK